MGAIFIVCGVSAFMGLLGLLEGLIGLAHSVSSYRNWCKRHNTKTVVLFNGKINHKCA